MNRLLFFNQIRKTLFEGKLSQSQVDNIEAIIAEFERLQLSCLYQLAYVLGTVYHETDRTMAPIEEYGKGASKRYGQRVKYDGKAYAQPHIYYGRGHTQNTWWDNYFKLTKVNPQGWDFLNDPELLLQMAPSVWATWYAMRTGLYTGKKLSDYFNSSTCDWINARKIINRLDKAEAIANHSKQFYQALIKASFS